jgi:S1-C subfamily serine protease/Tfp pilus assembly protein PilF
MWHCRSRCLALLLLCVALLAGPAADQPRSGPDVYRHALRSVAWVITSAGDKGTGWLIDRERRLLVTNYHVVGEANLVDAVFPATREGRIIAERTYYTENLPLLKESGRAVAGRVVQRDPEHDLALIRLDAVPDGVTELPLAAASASPGETVHAIGHRRDTEALWVYNVGVVRQVCRTREGYFWQGKPLAKGALVVVTQSPINEGDSGGPLLNDRGELVGVAAAVRWQAQLASVCIDVSEVKAFVAKAQPDAQPHTAPPARPAPPEVFPGAEIYRRLVRSSVWVKTSLSSNRASGWLFDKNRRLLLTTAQVVGNTETVDLIFPVFRDGKLLAEYAYYRDNPALLRETGHAVRGSVLARDAARNVALIEAESLPDGLAELPLAADSAAPGERVHTLGNPNGVEALWVYTAGAVRQVSRATLADGKQPDPRVLLAQLPLGGGDSGGPVVDDSGKLVALASGKDGPQQLLSYCLDVSEIRAFVAETRPRWAPQTAATYRQRAAHYVRTHQYDRALADYAEALRLDPRDASLFGDRAAVYSRKGETDRALADCEQALRLDPRLAAGYCRRTSVWASRGDFQRALADCAEALRLDEKCADGYSERGKVRRMQGELDAALLDCDRAVLLDPNLASAYFQRALVHATRRDDDRAIADYTRAIEFDPLDALAYRLRGDAYRRLRDAKAALADYTQALELDPTDGLALWGRGFLFASQDDDEKALADFAREVYLLLRLSGRK